MTEACLGFRRPKRLHEGDAVAIVSPSWGGPSLFPHVYDNGLKVLREWGLQVREYPTARASAEFLHRNPRARADDINNAFADPDIKAIFASIGGEDSIRLLPFLRAYVIAANSDTTTLLSYCNQQGLVTFHGPSIMAGFSQMESLPASFKSHVRDMLFVSASAYEYRRYEAYCEGYLPWSKPENVGKTNALKVDDGWRFLQGEGKVTGELFGGCIEVLDFLKGTDFWPGKDFWDGKILFFEISEAKVPVEPVKWTLRNYGMQGIFGKVAAILFGRARDYSTEQRQALDEGIREIVGVEFERPDLPIVTNMDFGHTDPQIVLPLGVKAELDCANKTFRLIEPWLE